MPSRIGRGVLISITVIALLFASVMTSSPETTTYIYDELNRLIGVIYENGSNVFYTYDASGNRITVGPDTVPPTGTITINSGAAVTYNPAVTLTLTCSDNIGIGCSQMQFSNDNVTYSTPETYATTKSWTLSPGYGTKTVYAKFKDVVGNWSTPYNDTIEYSAPWLFGWSYRKSVTLSRPSGLVTNYQMKLLVGESAGASGEDVDCNGHVLSSFNDLRFTTADGTTLLNYWIESITGTTPNRLATVWIKFNSIGTTATTFYMYYGKAGAPAVSNGANTFLAFEDFEWGNNGDRVTTSGGSVTWICGLNPDKATISTEHAYSGTRCMKTAGVATQTNPFFYPTGSPPSQDIAIKYKMWKEDADRNWVQYGIPGYYLILRCDTDEDIEYYRPSPAGWVDIGDVAKDQWTDWELRNFNFTAHTCDIYYNGALIKSGAEMLPCAGNNGWLQFISYINVGADSYWDNIIVRKFYQTGPTWGSWGSEEVGQ